MAASLQKLSPNVLMRFLFIAADSDDDGTLSKSEMNDLLTTCGYVLSFDDFEAIFDDIDEDGDGTIDIDEFLKVMKTSLSPDEHAIRVSLDTVLKIMFDSVDTDGKGALTKSEMNKLMMQCGYTLSWSDFQDLFASVDTDGNGVIDFDEFSTAMKTALTPASHNKAVLRKTFENSQRVSDNDGRVSLVDMKELIGDMDDGISVEHMTAIFRQCTMDGATCINYETLLLKYED